MDGNGGQNQRACKCDVMTAVRKVATNAHVKHMQGCGVRPREQSGGFTVWMAKTMLAMLEAVSK